MKNFDVTYNSFSFIIVPSDVQHDLMYVRTYICMHVCVYVRM